MYWSIFVSDMSTLRLIFMRLEHELMMIGIEKEMISVSIRQYSIIIGLEACKCARPMVIDERSLVYHHVAAAVDEIESLVKPGYSTHTMTERREAAALILCGATDYDFEV